MRGGQRAGNENTIMAVPPSSRPQERNMGAALAAFVERRSLVMLALGFSAGLPFLLIFDTLSAWLRASGDTPRAASGRAIV